jgi:hypothetical protein
MPGESPAVFGDALRRLAAAATYLYQDGPRFWYATQPTVTRLAEDRAEQLKRDPDKVAEELDARLRKDLRKTGDFDRVHPMPQTGTDVPDDHEARLVVLPPEYPYSKGADNAAETAAQAILESRGTAPRMYRNTLVFLAADKVRLQDLDEAVRKHIAWQTILDEKETLNLDPNQVRQADTQKQAADSTVDARLPETYQWLMIPSQGDDVSAPVSWEAIRLTGSEALAVRASRKLRTEEALISSFGSTRLRQELDRVPLWRDDRHVTIRQLIEDFASYTYLPRLAGPEVLVEAVRSGLKLLTWERETFGYAESYDEGAGRYRGLRGGEVINVTTDDPGLLVKPAVARSQLDEVAPGPDGGDPIEPDPDPVDDVNEPGPRPPAARPRRYYATVELNPGRIGRDAGEIGEEVIAHLAGLVGADVRVTLEIEADVQDGIPEHVVRIVTENGRTLKFTSQEFELD